MAKGDPGQHPTARRALHETLLDQVWLDDLFDDVALVAERRGNRLNPYRTPGIVFGNAAQVSSVHAVETAPIDIEPPQRRVRRGRIYVRHTLDGGKVANATQ